MSRSELSAGCETVKKIAVDSALTQLTTLFLETYIYKWGFLGGTAVKHLPAKAGGTWDVGSVPESGRAPGVGDGNHASSLAWKVTWTEESGGLSRGHRVGRDWAHMPNLCVHVKLLWLCPTHWHPVGHSSLGSSLHGTLQARIHGVGCHALL